jgi:RNA polymerase sigma factor (sigma-70 family)
VNGFFQENYETLQRWALQITAFDRGLADDILHDAFLRLHKGQVNGVDEVRNLDGYVYTAIRNSYRSHLRKHSRRRSLHLSIFDVELSAPQLLSDDPSTYMRTKDDLRAVCEFACKRKSKSIAASILILRFFHGYYPGEISRLLNRSRNAVETRLMGIRREVIEHLSGTTKEAYSLGALLSQVTTPARINIDLIAELQQKIFDSVSGECILSADLKRLYRKDAYGPDRDEISHVVSCRECLDSLSKALRMPGIGERHPLDALGVQTTVEALQLDGFRILTLVTPVITFLLTMCETFAPLVS